MAVKVTMVSGRPSSISAIAEASSAAAAAFRNPCGDSQMSSCRTSASCGRGTSLSPIRIQLCPPLVSSVRVCSPTSGAPPPRGGKSPCRRVWVSTDERAS